MTQLQIHGIAVSTYTRTARMVCEEKGIAYDFVQAAPGSPEHLAGHPFGKLPWMTHGDVRLYETSAIARYIDETFQGPSLVPATTLERARMEQWISAINSYLYEDIIRNYAFHYIFPKTADKQPDRAAIEAAVPNLRRDLMLIDKANSENDWLAGKTMSLADLFLCPILAVANMFPEAKAIMADCANIRRVGPQIMSRPSFSKTQPPMPAS